MKTNYLLFFALLPVLSCGSPATAITTEADPAREEARTLIWSDEFDGTGALDPAKWDYDLGDHGWGNNQLEDNTNRMENARRERGKLIIEAMKLGKEGDVYSSARLVTRGKASWTHVRVEVNARLPSGRGTWPAIWMLGDNISEVGWPMCGEIDIMEHVGYAVDSVYGTVHTKAYNHVEGTQVGGSIVREDFETDFHTYFIDWTEERIDFGVNETVYFTFNRPENATVEQWPFDAPHYLILNLAVGGNWGGKMGVDDSIWPQRMEVDWVRVYR